MEANTLVNSLAAWKEETIKALLALETEEDCQKMHSIIKRVDLDQFTDIEAAFEHRLYILDKIVERSGHIRQAGVYKSAEAEEIETMKALLHNGGDNLLDDLKAGREVIVGQIFGSDYDKWMHLAGELL